MGTILIYGNCFNTHCLSKILGGGDYSNRVLADPTCSIVLVHSSSGPLQVFTHIWSSIRAVSACQAVCKTFRYGFSSDFFFLLVCSVLFCLRHIYETNVDMMSVIESCLRLLGSLQNVSTYFPTALPARLLLQSPQAFISVTFSLEYLFYATEDETSVKVLTCVCRERVLTECPLNGSKHQMALRGVQNELA